MKRIIQEISKDTFKTELVRKSIHLCSLSMPIIYYFINRETALLVIIPATFLLLSLDLLRYYSKFISKLWLDLFGFILRKHETTENKKTLTGGTYVLVSASICVLFFPKVLAITSFAILIISDISAALIGKKIRKD